MSGGVESPRETSTRRTRVVFLLDRLDTPVTVDQLVDELVREEEAGPSWERLHERLHDEDLPALDRVGLLSFDADRGLVSRQVEAPLPESQAAAASAPAPEDGRHVGAVDRLSVGLSAGSLGLLTAVGFDAGPFAALPDVTVASALVVLLALASLATVLSR